MTSFWYALRKKIIAGFTAAALSLQSVSAAPIEEHIQNMVDHLRNSEWDDAMSSGADAAKRLKELYDIARNIAKPIEEVADNLTDAMSILNLEPQELGAVVDMINDDTDRINSINVELPEFGNPMSSISEEDLLSDNPTVRGEALDEALQNGEQMKKAYAEKLKEFQTKQEAAKKQYEEAVSAYDRGVQMEKVLGEINSSPEAVVLNLIEGKFAMMFLDMAVSVNPALAKRRDAAKDLVIDYDNVISEMEITLEEYGEFEVQASYIRYQEWVFENASSEVNVVLEQGNDVLKEIDELAGTTLRISPARLSIQEIIDQTISANDLTKQQAEDLVKEALEKDREAARKGELQNLLSLASAMLTLGAMSKSGNQNPNYHKLGPGTNPMRIGQPQSDQEPIRLEAK